MHKRDYILIATVLKDIEDRDIRRPLVHAFAYALQEDNANFNIERFIRVCMDASVSRERLPDGPGPRR